MITPEPGIVIAGRYILMRLLGRGGMGSVWLARHRELEIDVAVKFMAPALVASVEARMRFEREAKVAAPLSSQHVVQVHDYGVEDGTPYIIMELLKGESLSARLARESRFRPPVAARLLVQICKALCTAHEAGLVHRDLKPANIFLALKDRDEVVKVLDFGIAKIAGYGEAHPETATGMMLGSAHYMSPEQIRSSRQADHRSDLWSVGIILYRMLTGRLPFAGVDLGDVLVRVCTDVCQPPSSIALDLPARIDGFFERALARDPGQRFQSAMELTEAFDAVALDPHAPSPRPVAQWNETIVITSPPAQQPAASVGEGARDSAPTSAWIATSSSSEGNPASISAVLVADPRAQSSPLIIGAPAGDRRSASRSLWPVAAMAVVVTLVGVLGAAFRVGAPSSSAPAEPKAAATSAPAEIPPIVATVVAAAATSPAPAPPPPPTPPPVSAAPSASASAPAPAPRVGKVVAPPSPPRSSDTPPKPAPSVEAAPAPPVKLPNPLDKQD